MSPDVAVVGGGIVGLATAVALARRGARVLVLEAEDAVARHQSGRNSGVIHSGLYYRPGSLKARLSTAGRRALLELCDEERVPYRLTGKLVVATREGELPALDELERRGRANGLEGLERLDARDIQRREPEVAGVAGLWVPETGLVDYAEVCRALVRRLERAGGELRTGARLRAAREERGGLVLDTTAGPVSPRRLVNCAGLQSDRVARLCGLEPGLRIVPFRGEYCEVAPPDLVRVPIYPVPDPRLPFLGVHLTPTLDGRLEAGPNAVLAWKREGYRRGAFSARDARDVLAYPGFWRLARRHWRTGAAELGRSLSLARVAADLRRLVPAVRARDLRRAGCGVRAQAVDRDGRLLDDFRILEDARGVHVLNAPSPAATASLAIGEHVADRVSGLGGDSGADRHVHGG